MKIPDHPRALSERRIRRERAAAAIEMPHVRALNQLVDRIEADTRSENLPYIDPLFGGVAAELLFVLKAPEGDADPDLRDRRFLSWDNDDVGAENFFRTCAATGLDRARCTAWNACPFPITGGAPSRFELGRAEPYTRRMLELLPRLRVVVLLGRPAQRAWQKMSLTGANIHLVHGASPSPPGINHPDNRRSFEAAIRTAVRLLD
ncbi:uracil-DNA glycosylase family protein [Nocardia sp. NPDC047654]|uniref:uracil-DNA glycosylase family protein n=1 Tax=Nocardia sp. NPDC047654 TaxID=3364314 RepID=UPI0037139B27